MSFAAPAPEDRNETYRRIARAITYLAENYADQPSLEAAARNAGYSPFHFQRVFQRLVGISPKAFVRTLTLEHAKRSLAQGESVFGAALTAGLSGPSRLHDLCLKIEAMTPGTYAKGGAGLRMVFGFHPSLFGLALVMMTEEGLCGLGFADEGEEDAALADMCARWPNARFQEDATATVSTADRIFSGQGEVGIRLFGTPWQIKIWQALVAIPPGKVTTYREVARVSGNATAARAAGAAIGRNPVSYLIPCHRVLAANGALTGYHWGVVRKRAMLALESARTAAGDDQRGEELFSPGAIALDARERFAREDGSGLRRKS